MRVGKLKNGKATGKDEITEQMIKDGGDRVVDWIWRLCNMAFENGVVPEDWRSDVIGTLYNGKEERNECNNYRCLKLSVVGKIYARILVEFIETGCLIDNEKGGLRAGKGCIDQIFILKQVRKQERKNTVYVGFIDLEKVYNRVNKETLWKVLRMYDVESKHLSGIKSMYVDSSTCVRVKGGESERFKDEPLTLMRCHSYMEPMKGEVHLWLSLQLKGHNLESLFFFSLKLCFSFTVSHFLA